MNGSLLKKFAVYGLLLATAIGFSKAEARCNHLAGSYLLSERFTNCDVNNLNLSTQSQQRITDICMTGCNLAALSAERRRQCDPIFAAAYDNANIAATARAAGCRDSGRWPATAGAAGAGTAPATQAPATPETACQWISRVAFDMTCGGRGRDTNICGAGGRAVCAGFVQCDRAFRLGTEVIQPGTLSVSCVTNTGRCDNVSMTECFSDVHTTPTDHGPSKVIPAGRPGAADGVR